MLCQDQITSTIKRINSVILKHYPSFKQQTPTRFNTTQKLIKMSWKILAIFCFLVLGQFVASGSPFVPLSYDREAEEDQVLKNYEALLELVHSKFVANYEPLNTEKA